MNDVFAVADLFVDLVRRKAPQDVALIVYYGSYAMGSATPQSDLDLYYIPDPGKAGALYRSIVYQGCPFEFWGVSWDFAERIATGKHHWCVAPSIIANAQVLYTRSEADSARFAELQATIARLQQPESRTAMIKLAQETFHNTASPLYRLAIATSKHDVAGAHWVGAQLIDAVLDSLALLNQVFFVKNWASDITQLDQLQTRPDNLRERIETILMDNDLSVAQRTAEALVADTRALILAQTHTIKADAPVADVFDGFYAAIQEYVNKILTACERQNWINASVVSAQMQKDVAFVLAYAVDGIPFSEFNVFGEYRAALDRFGFPDLTPGVEARDGEQLAALAREFRAVFQSFLAQHNVALQSADTLDALKRLIG